LAVTNFTRGTSLAAKFIAQERVKWFLTARLGSLQAPSFTDLVRMYIAAARKVQKAFRRILMIRQAHVEALMAHFNASHLIKKEMAKLFEVANDDKKKSFSEEAAAVKGPKSQRKGEKRGKEEGKKEPKPPAKPVKPSPPTPSAPYSRRRRHAVILADPAALVPDLAAEWVKDFKPGEEVIPLYIRLYVIKKHVREMHLSYKQRYAAWQRRKQDLEMEIELKKMALGDAEKLKEIERIPMKVEANRMRDLYDQTYNRYMKGGFKELVHSVRRQMKKVLAGWRKVVMYQIFQGEADVTEQAFFSVNLDQERHVILNTGSTPLRGSVAVPPPRVMSATR